MVGCFGNLSGTYWVVVIRPQLSRTATAIKSDTSNRSPISIFDRPMRIIVSISMILKTA